MSDTLNNSELQKYNIYYSSFFYLDNYLLLKKKLVLLEGIKSVKINQFEEVIQVEYDSEVISTKSINEYIRMLGIYRGKNKAENSIKDILKNSAVFLAFTFFITAFNLLSVSKGQKPNTIIIILIIVLNIIYNLYIFLKSFTLFKSAYESMKMKIFSNNLISVYIYIVSLIIMFFNFYDLIKNTKGYNAVILNTIPYVFLFLFLSKYIMKYFYKSSSSEIYRFKNTYPKEVRLVNDDKEEKILASNIQKNDVILVKNGETFAFDGQIIEGEAYVNENALKGKVEIIKKSKGDIVFAGSINNGGYVKYVVKGSLDTTYIMKRNNRIEENIHSESKKEVEAVEIASYINLSFFITSIVLIFISMIFDVSLKNSLYLSVVAISSISTIYIGFISKITKSFATNRFLKIGIEDYKTDSYIDLKKANIAVFDKDSFFDVDEKIEKVNMENLENIDSIIQIIYSFYHYFNINSDSEIARKFKQNNLKRFKVEDATHYGSNNFVGYIGGCEFIIGSEEFLENSNIEITKPNQMLRGEDKVTKSIYVFADREYVSRVDLVYTIREDIYEIIREYKKMDIEVVIAGSEDEYIIRELARRFLINRTISYTDDFDFSKKIESIEKMSRKVILFSSSKVNPLSFKMSNIAIDVKEKLGTDVYTGINSVNNNLKDGLKLIKISKKIDALKSQNYIFVGIYSFVTLVGVILIPSFTDHDKYINLIAPLFSFICAFIVYFNTIRINLFKPKI